MSDENETPEPTPRRPGWTPAARKCRKGMSRRLKHSLDAHAETFFKLKVLLATAPVLRPPQYDGRPFRVTTDGSM